jgi:hypothetical protein
VVLGVNFTNGRGCSHVDGVFNGVPGMVHDSLGFLFAYWVSVGSEYFCDSVFQFEFGDWVFVTNVGCVFI